MNATSLMLYVNAKMGRALMKMNQEKRELKFESKEEYFIKKGGIVLKSILH